MGYVDRPRKNGEYMKITYAQKDDIVKRYIAGETAADIAASYGVVYITIIRILKSRDIDIRHWKLTDQQRKDIQKRYDTNESVDSIADDYDITRQSVRKIAKALGSHTEFRLRGRRLDIHNRPRERKTPKPKKTNIYIERKRKYTINQNVFSSLTPDSCYWIGMLMADGNVCNHVISLGLSIKDMKHIKKFREFIGSDAPIDIVSPSRNPKPNAQPFARISIVSKTMTDDLERFGVIPRKSREAHVSLLEMDRDFWRGVIDGDGCVANIRHRAKRYATVSLVGSENLLTQFRGFIHHSRIDAKAKVSKCKGKELYQIQIYGVAAMQLMTVLYERANVFLDRKYEKVQNILEYHNYGVSQ